MLRTCPSSAAVSVTSAVVSAVVAADSVVAAAVSVVVAESDVVAVVELSEDSVDDELLPHPLIIEATIAVVNKILTTFFFIV
jgi:hypothetical protein